MMRLVVLALALIALAAAPAWAQLDRLIRDLPLIGGPGPRPALGDAQVAAGLKEALEVGTGRTVDLTGRVDGFLKNQAIKILLPPNLRSLEPGLRALGFGTQLDEFVVSMNRAAERAAPEARRIFVDAITAMSFDDARRILSGGETAATDFFKAKTTDPLTAAFAPIVRRSMDAVGVTREYRELVGQARALPFVSAESLDIDRHVVGKSLDGLFHVLAEQERLIRTDPAARTTELLQQVFASR
jgi:hypothetical protein